MNGFTAQHHIHVHTVHSNMLTSFMETGIQTIKRYYQQIPGRSYILPSVTESSLVSLWF